MPTGHKPNAPAWSAQILPTHPTVVYAQLGVRGEDPQLFERLLAAAADGPAHVDRAEFVDEAGHRNDLLLAYWPSPEAYERWDGHRLFAEAPAGLWREVLTIPAERFETLHSTDRRGQGVSSFCPIHPTDVHEYDGAARDRIAVTEGEGLCFIRTAQDWSACGPAERERYLGEVAPALERGALFLRDNPVETGCVSGRFVRELTLDGEPLDRTCFLGFFTSLAHLERWTWSHETHAAIFGSFMDMVAAQGFQIDLALWHEVCVLPADALHAEYHH